MKRYFVAGGAGFIGSHLVRSLLAEPANEVVVYDNFSSGRESHLAGLDASRLRVVKGDLKETAALRESLAGAAHVYHFASNPDIAKAVTQPDVDFWEGTYLTNQILEAMRVQGVGRLTYMSGSGIYGDLGERPVVEDHGPLLPTSTYGASKLAGEALICAYCHMFGLHAAAFRFANVVGPRQTHGVTYDFIRRLLREPGNLKILGDGNQSKSYIHVDDVVAALRLLERRNWEGFVYYNVATEDYLTVREIAALVVERLGLRDVRFEYTGGARGWKGDVPVVRFNSGKIRALGWTNRRTAREALRDSIDALIPEARAEVGL